MTLLVTLCNCHAPSTYGHIINKYNGTYCPQPATNKKRPQFRMHPKIIALRFSADRAETPALRQGGFTYRFRRNRGSSAVLCTIIAEENTRTLVTSSDI